MRRSRSIRSGPIRSDPGRGVGAVCVDTRLYGHPFVWKPVCEDDRVGMDDRVSTDDRTDTDDTERDEVDAIVAAWRRERPDLDAAPLQVLSRVSRLAEVLTERRANAFVEHGLRQHEFDVLSALRRAGEPFELTAGELAVGTHVTSGTMTSRLDRLEARGFVTRHADPSDGRLVRVALTVTGRQRVDAAVAALLTVERDLLAVLDDADRDRLAGLLRALLLSAQPADA